ncbi:hypothetical protein [Chlamydiifrater volucris]|uniref:hypothetical protein n=1 Tax=Chlamydiifrater volucris TaxID=2681470 RepID=UPI001BCE08DB|nr:hypothetical protein [Chlamydiifrater volucris]
MTSPISSPLNEILQQVISSQPQGSKNPSPSTDPHPGPSSREETSKRNISYNFNLGLGGLAEINVLETAVDIVKLLLSLQDNPRVIAGATACYNRLLPWCSSSCGCPKCGCPNGECGCGTLGALLCDCFKSCCLPLDADPLSEGLEFFQKLADKFGPVAVAIAFENLGIDLAAFLTGETRLDEDTKKDIENKAEDIQNRLAEVSQKKHDKKVLESLLLWVDGQNPQLKNNIHKSLKDLQDTDLQDREETSTGFPEILLDVGKKGDNVLSLPLSKENIMETLMAMKVFDLDLGCSGGIGSKDAALMARVILHVLSKWCSSSVTGVRVSVTDDLFRAVLSLVLLLFGYLPGKKEDITEEAFFHLQDLKREFPIDRPLLTRYFFRTKTEEVSSEEEANKDKVSTTKKKDKGKRKLEKKPALDEVDASFPAPLLTEDYGSVNHQRRLMELAQKICQVSGSFFEGTSIKKPQPPITQQPKAQRSGSRHLQTQGKAEAPLEGISEHTKSYPDDRDSGSPSGSSGITSTRL